MSAPWPGRLDDGEVALRDLRAADVEPYLRAFDDDPDLARWLGFEPPPTEAWVRERRVGRRGWPEESLGLAIARAADDSFLGEAGVIRYEERHRRAELAFWLRPEARGRGTATRALTLLIDWLLGPVALERLEITTTGDNPWVPRVAERLGFRREGLLRERDFEYGRRVDIAWFGLLRREWRGAAA